MSSDPALAAPRIPSIVPLLNPLVRRLVGAGLPFGPNVLLTVAGRSSGQPRTVPVAILEAHGRRYVQSPFGEVHWVRNLRASGTAIVDKGRRRERVEAREVPADMAAAVLRDALAPYGRSRLGLLLLRFLFHLPADATIEDILAESRSHPMFELLPAHGAPSNAR